MRIKALKTMQVGHSTNVVNAGDVVEVEDIEGKALVTAGLAKETTEAKSKPGAPENKAKGGSPETKADDNDALKALLDGSVEDVVSKLDDLTADELVKLRDMEAAGKNRKGIADAIAEYDLT